MCLSTFDCCEQGCGILDCSYMKVTKVLIAPQAAKQKVHKLCLSRGEHRKLHLLSMCDLS